MYIFESVFLFAKENDHVKLHVTQDNISIDTCGLIFSKYFAQFSYMIKKTFPLNFLSIKFVYSPGPKDQEIFPDKEYQW